MSVWCLFFRFNRCWIWVIILSLLDRGRAFLLGLAVRMFGIVLKIQVRIFGV
jgi:hypothetical protein